MDIQELKQLAEEMDYTVEEYLDFLCDDKFGLSYEEAVKQGLIEKVQLED